MAFSKTSETVYGITINNAYHRVESVSLSGKDRINFHVRSYVSPDKAFFAEQVLSSAYLLDGANPIKQAYEYLKTLPEFEGAIDC